ncbi:MAG: hypothetical protein ACR2P0_10310 [Acidimicrobiales bacterium]
MRISRDEAREIACTALLLTIGRRIAAGAVQSIQEIDRASTGSTFEQTRAVADRFLSHSGSTSGMLALGVSLLVVLSPTGSITPRLVVITERVVAIAAVFGVMSALNALTTAGASTLGKLEFALRNGFAAALLAGAGWWILRNLDPQR